MGVKFTKKDYEILSRLTAQVAVTKAKIQSDPVPFLEEAQERLLEYTRLFEEIENALHPVVFEEYPGSPIVPPDMQEDLYARNTKALGLLREFKCSSRQGYKSLGS